MVQVCWGSPGALPKILCFSIVVCPAFNMDFAEVILPHMHTRSADIAKVILPHMHMRSADIAKVIPSHMHTRSADIEQNRIIHCNTLLSEALPY